SESRMGSSSSTMKTVQLLCIALPIARSDGQHEIELAMPPVAHVEGAAVGISYGATDGKPYPHAGRLAARKRLEQPLLHQRRHSFAGIRYANQNPASVEHARDHPDLLPASRHPGYGLERVRDEIAEHHLDLDPVDEQCLLVMVAIHPELYVSG